MEESYPHKDLSSKIISCFYTVYNKLGTGFLEKVYEKALKIELEKSGLKVERQKPITVYYDDQLIGEYFADLVIEDTIILELKASKKLHKAHEYQLINYLKATEFELGLLLNFGKKPEIKRKVF